MTRKSTQKVQPEAEVQAEVPAEVEETPEQVIARLLADQERLMAELEAEKAKKARARRTGPTPKQRRLLGFLAANPDASIADACVAAGATATSHGFLWRLVEDGFLAVNITETGASYVPAEGEEPEESDESEMTDEVTEESVAA